MNFDFSDDQKQLRESVRRFLAEKCPLTVVRRVLDGPETHAADVWRGLAEMGVIGPQIPEAYGGAGLGALEACVVAEELGRACAPVPYGPTVYFATEALLRFGNEAQKSRWLPLIARGEAIGTFAVAEGPSPPVEGALSTTFANGKLTGMKVPVADGEAASLAIVLAGNHLVLVDLADASIRRERVQTIDPTRKCAKLTFSESRARAGATMASSSTSPRCRWLSSRSAARKQR